TAITAFVGRTLKGPVNHPVTVGSFNDYQRVFGTLWRHSTVAYAVEQYFENGGRTAIVVRICNNGHAPTIRLPAGDGALTLIGLSPGTREYLRASVDYDGIPVHETDRFNLILQRLRAPGSEFIEDQEIFRRLSIHPGAERSISDFLIDSRLMRVQGALPRQRPDRSGGESPIGPIGYVASASDGDDGDVLSNYDLIGDARMGTGVFALNGAEAFNFLCLPPLTREQDVGLPALLVALRYCRQRQAMLLLDPPAHWSDAAAVLDGLRNWPFFSEDAVMFFPRVTVMDRLRGRQETFGSAPAVAGMLARVDRTRPIWAATDSEESQMRPALRPATAVADRDCDLLWHAGVNVLQPPRMPRIRVNPRTLTTEQAVRDEWRYLTARRFALFIMGSIEQGTRWVVYEQPGEVLWKRVRVEVTEFLESLEDEGAFAGHNAEENYLVICDERVNDSEHVAAGRFQLIFGYASVRPGDFQTFLVTHEPGRSSVRPASVNRYALLTPE
ncbi:MAG TPA: phage tail sheath C-terminal domain-containing protein, partial [Steroidobacteraceae bacterium]|nr:phage tail sheath C-terminal domain-containing protein [Steroidobacteraceae bacterium]